MEDVAVSFDSFSATPSGGAVCGVVSITGASACVTGTAGSFGKTSGAGSCSIAAGGALSSGLATTLLGFDGLADTSEVFSA
ncbi:hypothetical protein FACS189494_06660 [Spirochaetia bacterium]|nr:hypothetical protein FACS189494_06660 [Spirochaetia bacterium]